MVTAAASCLDFLLTVDLRLFVAAEVTAQ